MTRLDTVKHQNPQVGQKSFSEAEGKTEFTEAELEVEVPPGGRTKLVGWKQAESAGTGEQSLTSLESYIKPH